jgi:hypothetical protein
LERSTLRRRDPAPQPNDRSSRGIGRAAGDLTHTMTAAGESTLGDVDVLAFDEPEDEARRGFPEPVVRTCRDQLGREATRPDRQPTGEVPGPV